MKIEDVLREYISALHSGDRRNALGLMQRAQEAGHDYHTLCLGVLQPALEEFGHLWQIDAISVAEEHIATAITQSAMLSLYQRVADVPVRKTRSFVGACAQSERHDLGLRMVCDFLDLQGWQTWYLGSSVPIDSLVSLVAATKPDAVGLSSSLDTHILELKDAIAKLKDRSNPPFVLVGGRAFRLDPSLATAISADATAPDAVGATRVLQARFPMSSTRH